MERHFYVVMVDGPSTDTHAHETLPGALALAIIDSTVRKVEVGDAWATDAGAARLMGRNFLPIPIREARKLARKG